MANIIYRLFLTLSATSLLLIVFAVKERFKFNIKIFECEISVYPAFTGLLLFLIPLTLTRIVLFLSSSLGHDTFEQGSITEIQYANNSFLPSYLGYFFVALSIGDKNTLLFVYAVLFIFTYKSQALYFNPIFLIFGCNFYNVKDKSGKTLFLITKEEIKVGSTYSCAKAYRINNFTYIEGD